MKKFFAFILTFIVAMIGGTSLYFYFTLEGLYWYHILLWIGASPILIPAGVWWRDYFKNLFGF